MSDTFYWHDYETWGINPAIDGPSQFAGVRTDMDLNIIGDPLVIYNQPSLDRLPHPQACAVTGITPQYAMEKGLPEYEFAKAIYDQLSEPNTCGVGYNSLRFDDEVSRFMFYRNFYPAYDREWRNGNSRWDLIDVMRLCYAVRPENIEWPRHPDGAPSFKLEDLSKANGLLHENAHDALSDVYATIGLAKLLKEKKPKLFNYALSLRDKKNVSQYLDVFQRKPVLYTSAYFSSAQACTSLVMPIAAHPVNKNAVIVFDLRYSPSDFLKLDAQAISDNMYLSKDEKKFQIPLMTIQINKSPMLAAAKLLDASLQERIQIDGDQCRKHYEEICAYDRGMLDLKVKTVYSANRQDQDVHRVVDEQLYGGNFFSSRDNAQMEDARLADASMWENGVPAFQDDRLNELMWRYQARHYPKTLDEKEKQTWLDYCLNNPVAPKSAKELSVDEYIQALDDLSDDKHAALKEQLRAWIGVRKDFVKSHFQ